MSPRPGLRRRWVPLAGLAAPAPASAPAGRFVAAGPIRTRSDAARLFGAAVRAALDG